MNVLECNYCELSFFSAEMRSKHHGWHMAKGDDFKDSCRLFDCLHCQKSFPSERNLGRHVDISHPEVPRLFGCPECSISFPTAKARDKHAKTHSVHQFNCRFCEKTFQNFSSLAYHISQVHWSEIGQKEPENPNVRKRMREEERESQTLQLECNYCDLIFPSKVRLWKHHSEHKRAGHEVKPRLRLFYCPQCSRGFPSGRLVAAHVSFDHVGIAAAPTKKDSKCGDELRENLSKPVLCMHCGKSFPNKGVLGAHFRSKHNELPRPHVCSTCGSGFLNEAARVAHQRLHTVDIRAGDRTEFEFACRFCPSGFDKFQKLAAHVRHVHYRETGLKHPQHC